MISLFLDDKDVPFLTSISGNIDIDALKPFIYTAQTTEIKRILGVDLYDKIYSDFVGDTLAGTYQTIFNDYVKDMLAYFSCCHYIQFGSYKISNAGILKTSTENGAPAEAKEVSTLANKYKQLAANVELNLKDYLTSNPVAEYGTTTDNTNLFNWY